MIKGRPKLSCRTFPGIEAENAGFKRSEYSKDSGQNDSKLPIFLFSSVRRDINGRTKGRPGYQEKRKASRRVIRYESERWSTTRTDE